MADRGAERRLVLLRHGRTSWNAEGRAQGHEDIGLDDVGFAQAEAAAEAVAELRPAVLVCSDLARARQTAAMVEKATGLTATEDPRLREYDTGERTGTTAEEYRARTGRDGSTDGHTLLDVPGAESAASVTERTVPALHDVLARTEPGQTAVVVTHGAAMRLAVTGVLGLPLEAYSAFGSISNCGWVVLTERAGRLRLTAYDVTAPTPD